MLSFQYTILFQYLSHHSLGAQLVSPGNQLTPTATPSRISHAVVLGWFSQYERADEAPEFESQYSMIVSSISSLLRRSSTRMEGWWDQEWYFS